MIPVLTLIPKRNANVQDPENRIGYTKYYVKHGKLSNIILKPAIKNILGQKLWLSIILPVWGHSESKEWEKNIHVGLVKGDEESGPNFEQMKDMMWEMQ